MSNQPATKKPPADKPKKGDTAEEAISEVEENSSPKTITVKGVEFTLPDKQPAELLFAARAASRAQRTQNEQGAMEAMLDMATAYIPEEALRDLMRGLSVEEGADLIQDLLNEAGKQYGTDQGES
jgi:hypothetical protein